ncbi:hypothetical protein TNCV_3290051 [Trichonephila clavipes]|nr:hypothetical protein TNCV_3290051 [Trichonephila clavipes]
MQGRKCRSCKLWIKEAKKKNRNSNLISKTLMCELCSPLIACNHVQLNNVSRSMFGLAFLETTSIDRTFCQVLWTVGDEPNMFPKSRGMV